MEQQWLGLTVLDSRARGMLDPTGGVASAMAVLYDIYETGDGQGLIDGASAIFAAGTEICNNYANGPCKVTNVLLYYGFPEDIGSEIEVRPVWAVEFYLGKAIVYVDAATGTVLDTTVSEEN